MKLTDKQESLMKKGNLKLSVFTSCPYEEIKKICDSIVSLGYDCEFVDNGNMVFQKIDEKGDEDEKNSRSDSDVYYRR